MKNAPLSIPSNAYVAAKWTAAIGRQCTSTPCGPVSLRHCHYLSEVKVSEVVILSYVKDVTPRKKGDLAARRKGTEPVSQRAKFSAYSLLALLGICNLESHQLETLITYQHFYRPNWDPPAQVQRQLNNHMVGTPRRLFLLQSERVQASFCR